MLTHRREETDHTRIHVQQQSAEMNKENMRGGLRLNAHRRRSPSRDELEGHDDAHPPNPRADLFWRLALVIVLSLTLVSVGTLFFINGFFLSRGDLPYISNGRELPFPPLFPHLDPAKLDLNEDEGIYYIANTPGTPRAVPASPKQGDSLTPVPIALHLKDFLDPNVDLASTEPEACLEGSCQSSWVSVTPYDRVFILLVDAMRFDFLLWDPEASNACGDDASAECAAAPPGFRPFYRNRLPFVHDILRRTDADLKHFLCSVLGLELPPERELGNGRPLVRNGQSSDPVEPHLNSKEVSSTPDWGGNHFARLYVFEADPPTATTQRVTGLATGSMPSFFSVRETFSASAVTVDSIMLQLKASRKTSVALGDDTWGRLFGHLLTRMHLFPSLNIQDLHTVDDGVAASLPREFAKEDWAFLVGHTLGVDHVGHAAVLDSELMQKKLTEVNSMLKDALKLVLMQQPNSKSAASENTLFLVFGDHGMTETGSHGGGSSEEVEAGLLSFSTLPAILSPRTAQMLFPGTRLFEGRLPAYLQNHGALRDNNARRRVGLSAQSASPTPILGYGSLRVRQVGLAPTLSLLLGLPIPFNSMGRVIADLVPRVASFVKECAPAREGESLSLHACETNRDKSCGSALASEAVTARAIRCSDLAYLTQLHHIAAWQQHRAILSHAKLTRNDAVLTDPLFVGAKAKWLRLYAALDKEVKSLPAAAHAPVNAGTLIPESRPADLHLTLPLSSIGSEMAETELISRRSKLLEARVVGEERSGGENSEREAAAEGASGAASILPSLVPYLLASAAFSQEAWQASVRQLCTFNMTLMICGTLIGLSSLLILACAFLALHKARDGGLNDAANVLTDRGLPELAAIARWLFASACIGGATWIAGWACAGIYKGLLPDSAAAVDVFVWRQLPLVCVTGLLCSVVAPFAPVLLPVCRCIRKLVGRLPHAEAEHLMHDGKDKKGLGALLSKDLCFTRLWLRLFSRGTLLCYISVFALCIVPFSDCFVDRECSIVKYLIGTYCLSAGITVFKTPSVMREKMQIVAACAALLLCVRMSSAFDPFASPREQAGKKDWPLEADSTSASAFIMFCIFCVVGMRHVPLLSSLLRSGKLDGRQRIVEERVRFQIASFQPLRGNKKGRLCTLERTAFLLLGAVAVVWFAFSSDTKSQNPALPPAPQVSEHADMWSDLCHSAVALLWTVILTPFKYFDAAGASCLSLITPPDPWLFKPPRWLRGAIPAQLMEDDLVKLVPLLKVSLPWFVYFFTAGLWLRLALVLCHLKKRENKLSVQQLCHVEAEQTAAGGEMPDLADVGFALHRNRREKEMAFRLWRVEFFEYFSYYLLLIAVSPICMFAVLLGRARLVPLLLFCIKWRLFLFLSRIRIVQRPLNSHQVHKCCICSSRCSPSTTSDANTPHTACGCEVPGDKQGQGQFLLSDFSVGLLSALLALEGFFATGHRMKLSALPIEAGFVGLLEFHPVLSVVTSFLHTYLVYVICCPLVFMIAFLRTANLAYGGGTERNRCGSTASAVVHSTIWMAARLALGILTGITVKHLISLLSLIVLRNHLFIWELFAVKFLYDTTAAGLVYVLVIFFLLTICIGAQRAPLDLRPAA